MTRVKLNILPREILDLNSRLKSNAKEFFDKLVENDEDNVLRRMKESLGDIKDIKEKEDMKRLFKEKEKTFNDLNLKFEENKKNIEVLKNDLSTLKKKCDDLTQENKEILEEQKRRKLKQDKCFNNSFTSKIYKNYGFTLEEVEETIWVCYNTFKFVLDEEATKYDFCVKKPQKKLIDDIIAKIRKQVSEREQEEFELREFLLELKKLDEHISVTSKLLK
eukprot:maker-scaffold_26-snap-gene-3.0-mRNA-1 protein AED:0.02 eAED:0.02 QI:83/1/1/1/0.5/0.33/3/100/219